MVEYGFSIFKDNNSYQFKIIICNKTNNINITSNEYFNKIDGLIICSDDNNNYDEFIKHINAPENIYIWFDKEKINNKKDLHYLFSDNNWINRIYNHIDIPCLSYTDNYCNIL